MEIIGLVVLGLLMGLVFGTALEKSRVMEPGVLIGQFQFTNFTMLKMFLAATATGLVALAILNGLGVISLHPKAFVAGNVLIGGLLLGAGIVIAGACPGTALAQIGAGYRDAWVTVAGGLLGAFTYGINKQAIDSFIAMGDFGKITFGDVFGLPFWALALGFTAVLIVVMAGLERWRPWRGDMPVDLTQAVPPSDETEAPGPSGATPSHI